MHLFVFLHVQGKIKFHLLEGKKVSIQGAFFFQEFSE